MKKILLSALASLLMMSASAQPAEGPRAPQGFRGPQPHFFAPEGMPDFEALKDFKAPEGFRAVKLQAISKALVASALLKALKVQRVLVASVHLKALKVQRVLVASTQVQMERSLKL